MALAAPLTLYNPPAGDFSTTAPAGACGDLSKPCASNLGSASLNYTPDTGPGWTYGGSVATGVGAVSGGGVHGATTAVAGTLWARSPDGQWTLGVGLSHQTFPGWGTSTPNGPFAFGHH